MFQITKKIKPLPLILFFGIPTVCHADYPERPVRVVVAFASAGGTDIAARVVMQKLTQTTGQSFVVDNRPGAGSMMGTEIVSRANPDGYTLQVVSPEFTVNVSLQPKVPYDALKDFSPIIQFSMGQYILATLPNLNITSVKSLIDFAKKNPKALNYASSGIGSANHLGGELFKSMASIHLEHIAYKGSGLAINAFLAGEVQILISSTSAIINHVRLGKVRALAVTALTRSPMAPDIPTVNESGLPGFDLTGWYGLVAPKNTPRKLIDKLNLTSNSILPSLKDRFADLGVEIVGGSAQSFGQFLAKDVAKWAEVVKFSGARSD